MKSLCFWLPILVMAEAAAAPLRHIVFPSNGTLLGPEANVVVYNDSDRPLAVSVYFGIRGIDPAAVSPHSCFFRKNEAQLKDTAIDDWDPPGGIRPYRGFEHASTVAQIPPKSFAHRYYPVGFYVSDPCEMTMTIRNESTGEKITSKLMLHKRIKPNYSIPTDVTVTSSVESVPGSGVLLATILLKNNATEPGFVRLVRKRLVGCQGDIGDGLVRQGMEGSLVQIGPRAYRAIKTGIHMSAGHIAKDCRLVAEFEGATELPPRHPLRHITVPLQAQGRYEVPPNVIIE